METVFENKPLESVQPVYAGFWIRFAAYFIDAILLSIPHAITTYSFFSHIMMSSEISSANSNGVLFSYYIILITIDWLYFASFESSSRQGTLGKIALEMKVTDYSGNRIDFSQASRRFFSKIVSGIILLIGFIMIGFDSKKQGLHDKIAETFVIKKY